MSYRLNLVGKETNKLIDKTYNIERFVFAFETEI